MGKRTTLIQIVALILIGAINSAFAQQGFQSNTVQSGTAITGTQTTTTVGNPSTTVSNGAGSTSTSTGSPTVTSTTAVNDVVNTGTPTSVTTNGTPTSTSVNGTPTTEVTSTEITTTTPVTTTTVTPTTTVTTTPVTTTRTTTTTTTTSTPTTTTVSTPQTTTVTTPTTTTTTNEITTTTVNPTITSNVITTPQFKNAQGGGSSVGWDIEACGGSGCAFSPTQGYKTSFATGRISQIFNVEDFSDRGHNINAEERGQGASFVFGAKVNNTIDNTIGNAPGASTPDDWSIKLDIKAADGTVLGTQTITGNDVTNAVQSGTLHINSGNTWDNGKLTLEGIDVGFFAGFFGPRFNDTFTHLIYNEINRAISTQVLETIAFSTQITVNDIVSSSTVDVITTQINEQVETILSQIIETTNSEIVNVATTFEIEEVPVIEAISTTDIVNEVTAEVTPTVNVIDVAPVEVAPVEVAESPAADTGSMSIAPPTIQAPAAIEPPTIEAPSSGTVGDVEIETVEAEVAGEVAGEMEQKPAEVSVAAKPAKQEDTSNDRDTTKQDSGDQKTQSQASDTKKEPDAPKAKAEAKKPETKAKRVAKAKSKAAKKIIKKMGDKGRYEGGNQLKQLVIMQVLGNTRSFFDQSRQLADVSFYDVTKTIPDAQFNDNNYAAYALIQGSDQAHDALINLQYKE